MIQLLLFFRIETQHCLYVSLVMSGIIDVRNWSQATKAVRDLSLFISHDAYSRMPDIFAQLNHITRYGGGGFKIVVHSHVRAQWWWWF